MRFTDSKLTSFKQIMNEFFYDWGMTKSPQINQSSDRDFWINKTSLFKEEDSFYLTYKMDNYEVSPEAFNAFSDFYHRLYKGDDQFDMVLGFIEDEWFENDLQTTATGFNIGELQIVAEDFKYLLKKPNFSQEISKRTFQKIQSFYQLIYPKS